MTNTIESVPGDPRTEPVATAEQSHVDGRVGPPTFAQDASNEAYTPDGVTQIEPGQIVPADTAFVGGPVGELADRPEDAEQDGDQTATADEGAAKPSPRARS